MDYRAVSYAILSAALFGVSTPAAKFLLGSIDPTVLAGLLYCGTGFGMAFVRAFAGSTFGSGMTRPSLGRTDWLWLAGAILAGGIAGPVLLLLGLARTDAASASLLLTLESVVTALIAWFFFGENFDRRIVFGMLCLVAGAAVLSWTGRPSLDELTGPLAIIGACAAWGIDNNLTRKVSLSDPLQIVQWKGIVAGPVMLAMGLWSGAAFPAAANAALAAVVGFVCYGISLALFIVALRDLGTARTAAYFSTAPFFGVVAAVIGLGQPVTPQLVAAGLLMGIGIGVHITERHRHRHTHDEAVHAHAHMHDEHHHHLHEAGDPPGEPHTHRHRHEPLDHAHVHVPDAHHRHRH
jgi:drug/metabolite transporter (DMT)-like permease